MAILSKKGKNKKISVNDCTWSRSFDNLLRVNPPPPPPPQLTSYELEFVEMTSNKIAVLELYHDISFLRNQKNDIDKLKLNIIYNQLEYKFKIIILFLIFIFLMGLGSIIWCIRYRKKSD